MIILALLVLFLILRIWSKPSLSCKHLFYVVGGVLGSFLLIFASLICYDQMDRYLHPDYYNQTVEQIHQMLQNNPVSQPVPKNQSTKGVMLI